TLWTPGGHPGIRRAPAGFGCGGSAGAASSGRISIAATGGAAGAIAMDFDWGETRWQFAASSDRWRVRVRNDDAAAQRVPEWDTPSGPSRAEWGGHAQEAGPATARRIPGIA